MADHLSEELWQVRDLQTLEETDETGETPKPEKAPGLALGSACTR